MIRPLPALLLAAVALVPACDRPFVPVRTPEVEILAPDPAAVLLDDRITLRLRATSFRGVSRVEVDGLALSPVGGDVFEGEVPLVRGINRLVAVAWDSEETPGVDTLRFLRLDVEVGTLPGFDDPMGAWTATPLPDGSILFAGGAPSDTARATDRLLRFDPAGGTAAVVGSLVHARAGHAATLLPDGRILVTGGASRGRPRGVHDLVEEAERIDPATFASTAIRTIGDPIRNAGHTAELRTNAAGLLVDLVGGAGDVQYRPSSEFGVRRDLRSFVIAGDSLVARHPGVGPYVEPLAGHVQVPLSDRPAGLGGRHLVQGWSADGRMLENHALLFDTAHPQGIDVREVAPPVPARNDHAGVRDADGLVWLLGGRVPEGSAAAGLVAPGGSVFVPSFGRFFALPEEIARALRSRVRSTATLLPDGRILLSGGWSSDGNAEPAFEILQTLDANPPLP